jgi:hypothetical protein
VISDKSQFLANTVNLSFDCFLNAETISLFRKNTKFATNAVDMNSLELKKKIIKQIDHLNEDDFGKVYHQLLDILKPVTFYKLSDEENEAIDSALKVSEEGETYTHNEIISEAQVKFPNLKFK